MLGDFTYCNPTKLYFGKHALDGLNEELPKYGKRVMLVYGGGSIKKNGIYDKVVEALKANGKEIYEDSGVMPTLRPTSFARASNARERRKPTLFWLSAAARCAIMPKRFPCR